MGFGSGSNNYVEVLDLKTLILFALENVCQSLQIFSDSTLVINWFNKIQIFTNIHLSPNLTEIQEIAGN